MKRGVTEKEETSEAATELFEDDSSEVSLDLDNLEIDFEKKNTL